MMPAPSSNIPANSRRYVLDLLFWLAATALSLSASSLPFGDRLIFLQMALGTVAPFFATNALILLLRSWRHPAVEIDTAGFTDHTGLVAGGFVLWSEAAAFEKGRYFGEDVLYVVVSDDKFFRRRFPRVPPYFFTGGRYPARPIYLRQRNFTIPLDEVKRLLEAAQREHTSGRTVERSAGSAGKTMGWWTGVAPEDRRAVPLRGGAGER